MQRLWFRAKNYGYGWYPATWEGWAVTGGFVVALLVPVIVASLFGQQYVDDGLFPLFYLPYALVLIVILLWICVKTGEKARWRWGGK